MPLTAKSQDLPAPAGEVLLTITGLIDVHNMAESAVFDASMLRELESATIRTTTIWTEGAQEFVGVPLDVLLGAVGARGSVVSAQAINDYAVDIDLTDETTRQALVAYLRNGQEMSVRDKGPLWIVYPYDLDEQFQSETIYSRSIWQLDRLDVKE